MRKRSGNKNKGPAHNRHRHGMTGTPTYKSWAGMHSRCSRVGSPDYKNYGGRGIAVCKRWGSFEAFLSDMGVRPKGLTIERRNNDGDYEPTNCLWASRTDQSRNRRFVKLTVDIAGNIRRDRANGLTLQKLSERYGISISHAHRVVAMESWT